MPLFPLRVTLEPVTRHRLRAVFTVDGTVIDVHDIDLGAGAPGILGGDLSDLVDAANLHGRPIEVVAPWEAPRPGAWTLRQKLRRYLSEYLGPRPRRDK